jgi:MerR family transcriptional regulator, light-induced transcriptional regulator
MTKNETGSVPESGNWADPGELRLSIAAVERDTGLSKDTLRVWERRYGFPSPRRDSLGERAYSLRDVEKLRIVRRLMDAGHRPGKIIGLPPDALQQLAGTAASASGAVDTGERLTLETTRYIDLIRSHDVAALRGALAQAAISLGLGRFVLEHAAPLNRLVGEAWARGEFEIFEEHLYTESMQVVLRNAISGIPPSLNGPRVLLTTFPNELHGLGLLMAEALLALEGGRCLSLGTQTPLLDIVRAAESQASDVVALSFSAALTPNQVLDGLVELRAKLPPSTEIWAGGRCPVLRRRPPAGITVLEELASIPSELERWRASRSARRIEGRSGQR